MSSSNLLDEVRDALFVSAGDHHLLNPDLHGPRHFDLLVAWYGTDETLARSLRDSADVFVEIQGGKFQNLLALWQRGDITLDGSIAGWGVDHWFMNVLGPHEPQRYVVDHSIPLSNPQWRASGGWREVDRIGNAVELRRAWYRVRDDKGLLDIEPVVLRAELESLGTASRRTFAHFCRLARYGLAHPTWTHERLRGRWTPLNKGFARISRTLRFGSRTRG